MTQSQTPLQKDADVRSLTADDYAARLDPQMKAFVEKTNAFYPPDAVDLTIADHR